MNLPICTPLRSGCRRGCLALTLLALAAGPALHADQLPNPSVTASARPFNASYTAANLFDAANAEYASLSQGAVSAPFTTNILDGTWVQLDFGTSVQFDRFVMRSRANNVDVIGESRLIVSADPVFDASDAIYTFNPTGANGAGPVQNLGGTATGRYVRWEVTTRTGSGLNLGANQMWFLVVPAGHSLLPPTTVVASSPPFNASYAAANAVNADYGIEYASLGAQGSMFIDFDFGAAKAITGFEFLNRIVDHVTTYDLIFADTPDFASPLATKSFTASADGNFVNSATFAAVSARYVRLQATGFAGANNTGVREIQFFTVAGQPPSITQVPVGGTRLAGDRFTLSAAAVGDNPLSFQWLYNGAPVTGATGSSLVLSNLLVSDSGEYQIVATNPNGSVTSAPPATLTVIDPPLDITSDLRVWLRMDETFGLVAIDDSGNARDGTLTGFANDDSQWVAGRINGALRLNPAGGADDDVVIVPEDGGTDFSSGLAFTLAAWVNGPATQEAGGAVFAKGTGGGGEQFAVDINANAYRFFVRNSGGAAAIVQSAVLPNDTWQHLVAVYSEPLGVFRIYINGVEVASGAPTAGLLQNSHEVSIGSRQLSSGAYDLNFNGKVDDVRIYGRALTPRDVTELYNQAELIPPSIITPPAGGVVFAFENFALTVAAEGSAPLQYQWSKNGTPIPGGTNASLALPNISAGDAGSYTVRVRNAVGSADSAPAIVTVSDPAPALDTDLVLHLKLDETTGSVAVDASGLGHDGTLQGFADSPWTTGIVGGAIALNPDGAAGDDVVLVPDDGTFDFSASMEFSLSAWVNAPATQEAGAAILCKGTGAGNEQFCLDAVPAFRFFGWTGAQPPVYVLQSSITPDETWQHVAGVFSRSLNRLKLYVDGVEAASGMPPASIVQNSHEISVGSRQLNNTVYDLNLQGAIDDVRVYRRALTPREIKSLAEFGHPPRLNITASGGQAIISWPATGASYVLESSSALPAPSWDVVAGVVNNQVTVSVGSAPRFFRLRRE